MVRNGDKSTVAEFTVVAAAPVVEGVQEGGKYDVYLGDAPVITFDVGEATLNGEPFVSGTKVETVGDYTLVVDNDGSVVTIKFSVIDTKPEYVLGDPDGDGEVTILDALMVLRASVGYASLTGDELLAADVDKDDKITTADALGILRVSSGLSQGF